MLVYVTDPETKQLAQVVSRSESDGFSVADVGQRSSSRCASAL